MKMGWVPNNQFTNEMTFGEATHTG